MSKPDSVRLPGLEKGADERFLIALSGRLRAEREACKMNLRQLGELTGYSYSHHGRVEQGKVQPGILLLLKWCQALELNLVEVLATALEDAKK